MKKVLILFGGNSSEHYVSCKSAKSIVENIDKDLFSYEIVGIDLENDWYLFEDDLSYLENGNWKNANISKIDNIIKYLQKFDVVFPMIHGTTGEDGKLQGMLELFKIPFVGSKTLASAICMDKEMAKLVFKNLELNQVPYVVITNQNLEDVHFDFDFPMIVKPANGGSSIGIYKVDNKTELQQAIIEAKKYDKKIIVEKFISCRELECAVLQTKEDIICSYPGEIKSANAFYDYNAKYENAKSYTIIPKDLNEKVINEIKKEALEIFTSCNCKGYARIDFFYDEEKEVLYINEINTIPGFTSISMYPILINHENISFTQLITTLINNA